MTMTYRSEYAQALPGRDLPACPPRSGMAQRAKSSACRGRPPPRTFCSCPTAPGASTDGSGIGRRLARGVRGRRARPLRPALRLLRDGGNLWPRGRASSDVGASSTGLSWARHVAEAPRSRGALPRGPRFRPCRSSLMVGSSVQAELWRTSLPLSGAAGAVVRSVQCGSRRYSGPSTLGARREAGEPLLDEQHGWRAGSPAPRHIPSGRLVSSTDRAQRGPRPWQRNSRNIAALAAATRPKAPRKPCTCSALPFGR